MLVDQLSKDVDLSGVEIIDPVVALHERVSKFHVALSRRLLYPLPLAGFPPRRVSFFFVPITRVIAVVLIILLGIDCAQWRRGAWICLCATQVCYDRWATAVK